MEFNHETVLLHEAVDSLHIKPDGIYIDATAGGGGHSAQIAKRLTTGRLICLDKDPDAIKVLTERFAGQDKVQIIQSDFSQIPAVIDRLSIEGVDGVLMDLGVSSHQLDVAERGFSYQNEAPLDMRMSQSGLSAYDVVNSYEADRLTTILRDFGEERFARRIADNILYHRKSKPIETTTELAEIVKAAIPAATRREGGHPAKRSFQAIRMEVNGELESLRSCLNSVFDCLNPNGRFSVITFHSLEDRMVKHSFLEYAKGCICPKDFPICVCGQKPKARLITRKAVKPSAQELERNNRSRSAGLRTLERI